MYFERTEASMRVHILKVRHLQQDSVETVDVQEVREILHLQFY
jgi:hypothetical protein